MIYFYEFLSCREAEKRQKKKLLLDYLYANLKNHNFWAYRYFFCEFLGILNVVGKNCFISPFCSTSKLYCPCPGQMFLMDRFFDGTFLTFGIEVISFAERDQEDRIDPMVRPSNAGGTMIYFLCSGLYFPPDDQVYFPQVRDQWRDREARCHVYTATQYRYQLTNH